MKYVIELSVVGLVLVGMLFGFHIQVSPSLLELLNSLSTFLAGFGTVIAAFIAYKTVDKWKEQSVHNRQHDAFDVLWLKAEQWFTAIEDYFVDAENIILAGPYAMRQGAKSQLDSSHSARLKKARSDYARAYRFLESLLNEDDLSSIEIGVGTIARVEAETRSAVRRAISHLPHANHDHDELAELLIPIYEPFWRQRNTIEDLILKTRNQIV